MNGTIFDIKRFAIHDGPGIRTTVFLKGCNLNCVWCQNPEGIPFGKGIWVNKELCKACGSCVDSCPTEALKLVQGRVKYDEKLCTFCDACIEVCPTHAIRRIDRSFTIEELVEEVVKDRVFFDTSNGGVTLSGGEPLGQPEFAIKFLERLKQENINTCIETALFVPQEILKRTIPFVDHYFVDIKLFDTHLHKKYIGTENELILENFRYLASRQDNIVVRVPLIPGITAHEENLKSIASFVHAINPRIKIELLNFNWVSKAKYDALGIKYFNGTHKSFSEKEMDNFNSMVLSTSQ